MGVIYDLLCIIPGQSWKITFSCMGGSYTANDQNQSYIIFWESLGPSFNSNYISISIFYGYYFSSKIYLENLQDKQQLPIGAYNNNNIKTGNFWSKQRLDPLVNVLTLLQGAMNTSYPRKEQFCTPHLTFKPLVINRWDFS